MVSVRITLVSIGSKRGRSKRECEDLLVSRYLKRSEAYGPAGGVWCETEAAFWTLVAAASGRTSAKTILFDSRGRALSSVEFAGAVGVLRDQGAQEIFFGIGGADGWSAGSLERASLRVSFGRMTLPHSLARVVAAEQIYRAMTILANHPYHCDHEA